MPGPLLPAPAAAGALVPGRRLRRALPLAAALAFACGGGTDSGDPKAAGGPREATTDGGTWVIRYTPDPDPIPLSEPFSLALEVEGPAPAGLAVDAQMPAHGHGMPTLPVVSGAEGAWTAEGLLFQMAGEWEILVAVEGDGQAERATFPYTCCAD
jgi:hypothetical protein